MGDTYCEDLGLGWSPLCSPCPSSAGAQRLSICLHGEPLALNLTFNCLLIALSLLSNYILFIELQECSNRHPLIVLKSPLSLVLFQQQIHSTGSCATFYPCTVLTDHRESFNNWIRALCVPSASSNGVPIVSWRLSPQPLNILLPNFSDHSWASLHSLGSLGSQL